MEIRLFLLAFFFLLCIGRGFAGRVVYSATLVHRFSNEVKADWDVRVFKNGGRAGTGFWPQRWSSEYYRRLLSSDLQRQTLKLKPQFQILYPSQGSATIPLGNNFGWLHYMWIDIGTPKVSFLVALDAGSDLFWVPCDCEQCAPLSASYYSSLDKDLNEYNAFGSSTSKSIACNHQLCDLGPNCASSGQQCPYTINYYSADASTSGFLVEDVLHLVPGHSDVSNKSVKASVILGCGNKQTGGYLTGVAPDGLLGLGLAEISVPSFLAKAGYIRNSFSLCFSEDDSGRLLLGDLGLEDQQTTPFLPLDGKNLTYIVGVDACCIGDTCLNDMNFEMLVDTGTSFTFLPDGIYKKLADEFDRHVNASKSSFQGYPWEYCYKSSGSVGVPKLPSLTLKFKTSSSFVVNNPVFMIYGTQGAVGFCLAIQPTDENIGTIGQNFMTGYQLVFDRENFNFGWSRSNCQDSNPEDGAPLNASGNSNSLPTTAQQSSPDGHAVPPAIAGRTPSKSSVTHLPCLVKLLFLLSAVHIS